MTDTISDEHGPQEEQTDTIATVDRRTVLTATVGLAGMAGCTGELPGGNDDTEAEDGVSDTSTQLCADTGIVVEGPDQTTHCVAPVESDQSIEDYYGYDTETQNSSALADEIEVEDATISFVYRNTSTGDRSLVVVHDSPDGGTAGDAVMTFQGIEGAGWLVKDDPEPRSASEAYETPGETEGDSISAVWGWSGDSSLTDGGAIGPLGESFDATITHHQEGTARDATTSREGIDSWLFVDGADLNDPIELVDFTNTDSGDTSIRLSTTDSGDGGDNSDDSDSSENDDGGSDGDSGSTDNSGNESGDDSSTPESGENSQTSTRQVAGEVSNDLTGFEVLEHNVRVGDDSLTGLVTLRNVGEETPTVIYHEMEIRLFDAEESIIGAIGSIKITRGSREPAPDEEVTLEFFPGPAVDVDFSQVASYEVVLTCGPTNRGVYCP